MALILRRVASSRQPFLFSQCTSAINMTRRSTLQRPQPIAALSLPSCTKNPLQSSSADMTSIKCRKNSNCYSSQTSQSINPPVGNMSDIEKNGFSALESTDTLSQERKDNVRTYAEAIRDLNSLQSNTRVLALAKYKHPETILPLFSKQLQLAGLVIDEFNRLNLIHISGTKGKGSTCAFLDSILRSLEPVRDDAQASLKVGSYNSPHLVKVTERIKINGQPIDEQLFTKYFYQVYDKLRLGTEREQVPMPSYFAFLTILAFHIFLCESVDCAIIEVGIGGEYDPTNIIPRPVACAITSLDLDHTNILGNTIKDIAWTKAGIIKTGAPMFTIEHEQTEALEMIRERAKLVGSPVYICKPISDLEDKGELGIEGPAQTINSALACHLAFHLCRQMGLLLNHSPSELPPDPTTNDLPTILETSIRCLPETFLNGLRDCKLPGRCQIIECDDAIFFLDGAHTMKSMENCLEWFTKASQKLNSDSFQAVMINVIGERDRNEVLRPLLTRCENFDKIVFTSNQILPSKDTSEAADSETLAAIRDMNSEKGFENVRNNAKIWLGLIQSSKTGCGPPINVTPTIMEGIDSLLKDHKRLHDDRSGKPHILVTGSLHFVGSMLETIVILNSRSNKQFDEQ